VAIIQRNGHLCFFMYFVFMPVVSFYFVVCILCTKASGPLFQGYKIVRNVQKKCSYGSLIWIKKPRKFRKTEMNLCYYLFNLNYLIKRLYSESRVLYKLSNHEFNFNMTDNTCTGMYNRFFLSLITRFI